MAIASVLLVEDNPLTRRTARRLLWEEGIEAIEAETGAEALDQLRPVDLVVQDISLPDFDGLKLIGQLRAIYPGRVIPFVAFTSYDDHDVLFAAGFAGGGAQAGRHLAPGGDGEAAPAEGAVGRGAHPKRLLVVDDDPVQLRLQQTFFTQAGFEVATAASETGAQLRAPAAGKRKNAL